MDAGPVGELVDTRIRTDYSSGHGEKKGAETAKKTGVKLSSESATPLDYENGPQHPSLELATRPMISRVQKLRDWLLKTTGRDHGDAGRNRQVVAPCEICGCATYAYTGFHAICRDCYNRYLRDRSDE
jgi:hypothetical protein